MLGHDAAYAMVTTDLVTVAAQAYRSSVHKRLGIYMVYEHIYIYTNMYM